MRRSGFNIDGAKEEDDNGEEDEDPQDTIHKVIGSVIYQLLGVLCYFLIWGRVRQAQVIVQEALNSSFKSGTSPPSLLPCKANAIVSSVFDGNKDASGCFAGKADPCIIFSSSVSHFSDKSSALLVSENISLGSRIIASHFPCPCLRTPIHEKSSSSSDQISTFDLLCSDTLLIIRFSRIYDNGGHLLCCETCPGSRIIASQFPCPCLRTPSHKKSSSSSDQISTFDLLCSDTLLIIRFSRIYDNGGHLLCCETCPGNASP